jgi:GT2 family glycosyltransferase/glycosyltransferase involved in cell wall biosynthesis
MSLNPLDHPVAWLVPHHLPPDPSVVHIPLVVTLVDRLAPRLLVELGTGSGAWYAACCQAIETRRLPTRCVTVPAAAADREFRRQHDERYAGFSLWIDDVAEALSSLPGEGVDLLLLLRGCADAHSEFDRWAPRLSARAVVLLDGIGSSGHPDLRELWKDLSARFPSFSMPAAGGLGVVAIGPDARGLLASFLDADDDERHRLDTWFTGLGRLLAGSADRALVSLEQKDATIRERDEALAWMRAELAAARRSVWMLEQRSDWYAVQLETIFASRSWRLLSRYRRIRERLGLARRLPQPATPQPPDALDASREGAATAVGGVPALGFHADPRDTLTLLPRPRQDEAAVVFDQPPARRPQRQIDVVCFSIIDWDFRFQRPQQVATQFAAHGHRVFFVSPSRFRPAGSPPVVRELADDIYEVELAAARQPDIYGENIGGDLAASLVESLAQLRHSYDISSAAAFVMISSWTDVALETRQRWHWPVIYDCMDEWENFQGIKAAIVEAEQTLVRACDLLVVTAARLEAKWAPLGRPMVLARNAADLDFYTARYRPNSLLSGTRHPIVGYYGAIADWFDIDLMTAVARARPQFSFVLLGGVFGVDVAALKALPNVSLLGQQPYATMPQYLYHFDVCLIPFKVNPITEATDPVKLYEYLSAGKPVVSVDLPELEPARAHIYIARDVEDFLVKLDTAVAEDDRTLQDQRRAFVADHTWAARYRTIRDGLARVVRRASVVIVTYNNLALTRLCLESIVRNTDHPNYEVIVVDNASVDGTPAYLRYAASQHPHVKVVLNAANEGFARANNQGLAEATGDDFVLLNNDTVVPHGWLTRLAGHLRDTGIGLVGPVTNFVGNEAKVEPAYRTWGEMEHFAAERARRYEGQLADISMLAMYCVAMRRETWERVGPLDEQFGIGMFEDDDYARRVLAEGLRVVCAADVFVHHVGQAAFKLLIERGEYDALFEGNRQRFEAKWQGTWQRHEQRALPFEPTLRSGAMTAPHPEDA